MNCTIHSIIFSQFTKRR